MQFKFKITDTDASLRLTEMRVANVWPFLLATEAAVHEEADTNAHSNEDDDHSTCNTAVPACAHMIVCVYTHLHATKLCSL
jgi:hypothetical protein